MSVIVEERWRKLRRGRLLAAAARVFARQPFDQASMDDIAHEAGVGKPTLYRYFPSKDALFLAVFERALDELEARLAAVLARESGIERRLVGLLGEIVPTFRDHLVPLRLLGETAALADQSRRRLFRERRSRIAGFLAEAIDAGARLGELRDADGQRLAHLMIGMVWSGTAASTAGATGSSDGDIAREIADLVLHGLVRRDGPEEPVPSWNVARGDDINGRPGRRAASSEVTVQCVES